jgi:hypothetical protein
MKSVVLLSLDDPRAPKYWMHETSGVLRIAVESYLAGGEMRIRDIAALRSYLRQWIESPVWGGDCEVIAQLRQSIDGLTNRYDIARWLELALEEGIDPL